MHPLQYLAIGAREVHPSGQDIIDLLIYFGVVVLFIVSIVAITKLMRGQPKLPRNRRIPYVIIAGAVSIISVFYLSYEAYNIYALMRYLV